MIKMELNYGRGVAAIQLIRIFPNPHRSATKALEVWLAGSLWGNPIRVDPDTWHVYGLWRRNWSPVWVAFNTNTIQVIVPRKP